MVVTETPRVVLGCFVCFPQAGRIMTINPGYVALALALLFILRAISIGQRPRLPREETRRGRYKHFSTGMSFVLVQIAFAAISIVLVTFAAWELIWQQR